MSSFTQAHFPAWPTIAWSFVALSGFAAPATALLILASSPLDGSSAATIASVLAIALMGSGMIGTAVVGRLGIGVLMAVLTGAALLALALVLGTVSKGPLPHAALTIGVASFSFAARGRLFACSAADKGWLIAVFVVAGEAAIVLAALAQPGVWPDWLLSLLPAQWASLAFQAALDGEISAVASAAFIALGVTALATLCVVWLWPRRWTYAIMFTTWLAMAALVHHQT